MCELFADLARLIRRDGLLSLDAHVSDPHESTLFQKYPRLHRNHHAIDFLCTGLTMIMDGKAEPANLMAALEEEVKVIEREHHAAVSVLSKTADALPGFGIVAAVFGIVVTMGAIDGPASEIGHKVGTALVGTFLGILLSYGFFGPMAGRMELMGEAELNAGDIIVLEPGESTDFEALTDVTLVMSEREAEIHLFSGAIGHGKNPSSHRDVQPAPQEAARLIVFASHLLGFVRK